MNIGRWRLGRIFKYLIGSIVLLFGFYTIQMIVFVYKDLHCSEEESKQLITNLCLQYRQNEIGGNLCPALCDTKTIVYNKCTNYRRGKKVLFADCSYSCLNGSTVMAVLKSKNQDDPPESLNLPMEDGDISKDGLQLARTIFVDTVFSNMHTQIAAGVNVFSHVWSLDFNKYIQMANFKNPSWIALKSIWSLIQQDEYLFMKLYQEELRYIPRLYGTCGSFYVMEYAPPGNVLNPRFLHASKTTWRDRANIALGILEIAQSLETHFHEPVHFCDIKEENFGIAEDKSIKILDTDSLFFDQVMLKIMSDQKCTTHEDCDFFDCRGWCNKPEGKCLSNRTNNNLQNICEDIFINRAGNFYKGLLYNPPKSIAKELNELLEQCAYPNNDKGTIVRVQASAEVHWKLYELLRKSVNPFYNVNR